MPGIEIRSCNTQLSQHLSMDSGNEIHFSISHTLLSVQPMSTSFVFYFHTVGIQTLLACASNIHFNATNEYYRKRKLVSYAFTPQHLRASHFLYIT